MHHPPPHPSWYPPPVVIRHLSYRPRIEVEVWPASAEVYFQDERYVDPANTQIRFEAIVYNAPTGGVEWAVRSLGGGLGAGTIDETGLYLAPPKGSLAHGTTEVVIATAADDPLRMAFARVTLIGVGPAPEPEPTVGVFPNRAYVYYRSNRASSSDHNEFIDASNKRQLFRVLIGNSDSTEVEWFVDSGSGYGTRVGELEPWYLYTAPATGNDGAEVKVKARLKDHPSAFGEAKLVLINYQWGGIE